MAESGREAGGCTTVTFPELVWAHYQWEQQLHETGAVDEEVERRFCAKRECFEQQQGEILDAYWSRHKASAVALTVRRHSRTWRLLGRDPRTRLHRVSDWVTADTPKIADLLHRCDTVAIKVSEVLRGSAEMIAMQWLYSVESHLLGFIERTDGKPHLEDQDAVAREQTRELQKVEDYYRRAGVNAGRIVYFWGMMIGVVALALIGLAAAGVLWLFSAYDSSTKGIEYFFACYTAGAVGALVSVLSRMADRRGNFSVDYEVGRNTLQRVGSFRPFLGAVFGVAIYFALRGGLLQIKPPDEGTQLYYYAVLAFLAGFSERWATVVLGDVQAKAISAAPTRQAAKVEEEEAPEAAAVPQV